MAKTLYHEAILIKVTTCDEEENDPESSVYGKDRSTDMTGRNKSQSEAHPGNRRSSWFTTKVRKNGTITIPKDGIMSSLDCELSSISYPTSTSEGGPSSGSSTARDEYDEENWWREKVQQPIRRVSKWSIAKLRKQFQEAAIEELYERYWLRLQRLLLFKILLMLIIYGLIHIVVYNTVESAYHNGDSHSLKYNIFLGVALFFAILCAILVFIRPVYLRINLILAIAFWIWMNALLFLHVPFDYDKPFAVNNVYSVFYYIFLTQTMLPASRKLSVILGSITAVVDIVIGAIFAKDKFPDGRNLKTKQLICNSLIYICAILTGLYHKHLTDIAHRHTFLDTRKLIESDIHYSRKREKQTRMKEGLLLKIIPKHLLEDMKKVLNRKLVEVDMGPRKVFHELLVERHDDVSILYADIVSFTPLTSELEPSELVKALNELFGRFDKLAKAHNCLRIKMLGDCYYCVSGLPDPIPDHARNCVMVGLQMIKVIRHIRKETGVEKLDMRIGIHTGYVLSGVLGLKKWQYDVWSDDVTIANHMESAGMAGKVHITKQSLVQLKDEFDVVPADCASKDSLLKENNIESFFIADSELEKISEEQLLQAGARQSTVSSCRNSGHELPNPLSRRMSISAYMDGWGAETPFVSLSDYMLERTMPEKSEVNRRLERAFHLEDTDSNDTISKPWGTMASFRSIVSTRKKSNCDFSGSEKQKLEEKKPNRIKRVIRDMLASTSKEISPFTLRYRNPDLEKEFNNRKDSTFKFYVLCASTIFMFVFIIQVILLDRSIPLFITFGVGLVVFVILIVFTTGLKCGRLSLKLSTTLQMSMKVMSDTLVTNMWSKIITSFITTATILVASIIPVMECNYVDQNLTQTCGNESEASLVTSNFSDSSGRPMETRPCLYAPYFLFSCMVTLVSCSAYLRISHIVKIVYMASSLVVFNICFYIAFQWLFRAFDQCLMGPEVFPFKATGTLYTALLFVTLVILDRQVEKNLRLDFLCKTKIQEDKQEVQRNEFLNELLLANILPKHVAEHFTKQNRPKHGLYHQLCKNACVMFAAIPNFTAFFSTVDVTGKECLRLLNEIISTFDKLLILRQFDGIEKIKTIGSTYMAASGLESGDDPNEDSERRERNLVLMTRFGISIMLRLQELNQDAFYEYKLRIGIHFGEVLAGVVGAQKPQYDIWGDCVNIASRMESHGVLGKIQVHKETADILRRNGIKCSFRDTIDIKGKGPMDVYLVSENNPLFNRTDSVEKWENSVNDVFVF